MLSCVLAGCAALFVAYSANAMAHKPQPGASLAMPGSAFAAAMTEHSILPSQPIRAQILPHALAASGPACLLNENILRGEGGIFSIIANRRDGVVLRWAGRATSAATPCPEGADLLLSQADYRHLQNWRPVPPFGG